MKRAGRMAQRCTLMVGLLLMAGWAHGGEGDSPDAPLSTFDNAAFSYWQAAALIQDVLSESQFEAALFADEELPGLPPKALAYRPAAGRWLLQERLMLEALHTGASQSICRFTREGEATAQSVRLYREAARRVMLRALASAKAHEFVGNTRAAGSIYADLYRMLRHLDEDGDWAAAEFSLSLLPRLLTDIEGFLSRMPPRDTVELITHELDAADQPRFSIQRMLADEAAVYSEWLLADAAQVEAKVAGLYRNVNVKPALEELLLLEPDEDLARVSEWVTGYQEQIAQLSAVLAKPYPEAIREIRGIDGRVAGATTADADNPLLPLLMPAMATTYETFVAAEAHLSMIDVLCRATIYHDFVGGWPDSIEILAQFAGGELRQDPFTGGDVEYDLRGALPRVQVDAPRSLRERGAVTGVNLRQRLEKDESALAGMIREMQRQARMDETTSNRRADKDDAGEKTSRSSRLRSGR